MRTHIRALAAIVLAFTVLGIVSLPGCGGGGGCHENGVGPGDSSATGFYSGEGKLTSGPQAGQYFVISDLHQTSSGGSLLGAGTLSIGSGSGFAVAGAIDSRTGDWTLSGTAADGTTWTVNVTSDNGVPTDVSVKGSNGDAGASSVGPQFK